MGKSATVDRRVVKTKEAINKAFLELMSEKEFHLITINDIADRANVNRGTVYLHYLDKYDLLDKCIEDYLSKLVAFCSLHEDGRERTLPLAELELVFAYFETNFSTFSILFASGRTSAFRERLLQFVSDSLLHKLESPDRQSAIDSELNAQFMASAFVGIVEWWIVQKRPHPPTYMAEQLRLLFAKNELYDPT